MHGISYTTGHTRSAWHRFERCNHDWSQVGLILELVPTQQRLIGYHYSIGAHMAGRTAKLLESANKIGTIIGLDPTSVGYSSSEPEKRLDRSDALYVQVIHTDISRFGIAKPIGHGRF